MEWNSIIKKYFIELIEVVKGGVDFASKEVPLYLKELIAYEFYHSLIWAIAYTTIAILAGYCARYLKVKLKEALVAYEYQDVFPYWAGMFISSLIVFAFGFASIKQIDYAVKTVVAPRVIIVEKIQSLIRNKE